MKTIAALITLASANQFVISTDNETARQCNPQTKVETCNTRDDVTNNCNWIEAQAVDGQLVDMSGHVDNTVAKICGPGKFNFAPFNCGHEGSDPSRHNYKAEMFECTTKEDCNCREVKLTHFANCYSVSC